MHPRQFFRAMLLVACAFALPTIVLANDVNFESPPVHPVEISPSGDALFVAHLADHRLVVYDLAASPVPERTAEIMVGIEPVSVRARNDTEVWVVNHISDSISIVSLSKGGVVRTLAVGDEPTDVQFAAGKAFVCVSQEDLIRVYDVGDLDAAPAEIPLEGSDPRSLAISPDGNTLYVAFLDSGNRTSVIPFLVVDAAGGPPPPSPPMNGNLPDPPRVSLIVHYDGTHWVDETGGTWDAEVPYTMPDNDVVAIDTGTNLVTGGFSGVGTALFNIAIGPSGNTAYVSNLECFNLTRFEPNLQGRFAENRITVVDLLAASVTPAHLNTHIDYDNPDGSVAERALSLSTPLDIAVSSNGLDVYVAAFGSDKVGVLDAAGAMARRIDVGEGPAGLALDEARNRLYVYNRFSSSLSVVDLTDDSSTEVPLGFDPSPAHVRDGRRFLYNGEISSAHGDLSCATCHIFGGMDNIAWDLGDPTASEMIQPPPGQLTPPFHPMKGPMTTQALKGLLNTDPLHWRGDREEFADFNPAFESLMGAAPLSAGDFQLFEDFVFSMQYPPTPLRELNGDHLPSVKDGDPANGETLFLFGNLLGQNAQCVDCHAMPSGENGLIIPGPALQEDEAKVVPQLRNMYEKTRFDITTGETVRGYGYTHDGAVKDLFEFLEFPAFNFQTDQDQRDVEAFMLAFPTGTHPAVGAQLTMDGSNEASLSARLITLEAEADVNDIGLVAKGRVLGQPRGWTYLGGQTYRPDKAGDDDISRAALLALAAPGSELTFTAVVEGCENRLGIDRDLDGFRDGDELEAGSDPGDPGSTPANTPTGVDDLTRRTPTAIWLGGANPTQTRAVLRFTVGIQGPARIDVYDVRGRRVRGLINDPVRRTGDYRTEWDLTDAHGQRVASGVYFARLRTVDAVRVQRITILR